MAAGSPENDRQEEKMTGTAREIQNLRRSDGAMRLHVDTLVMTSQHISKHKETDADQNQGSDALPDRR